MLLLAGISEVHMANVKSMTMTLLVLFIVACSDPQPPPAKTKTVFDPLTHQLDRARDVQKTLDDSADRTRKAVDEQERGDNSH
jgi:hypothetical protein